MARDLGRLVPRGGLWSHPDFLKLWSAETISQLGTQVSQLALPLVAILVLDVSAFKVALLGVIEFAPFILFTLPAGVWVDRLPRRPILIIGDVGRAALLASVPLAYAFDALTIWQLYAVGFGVGILTVFFDVAYQSYLPSLVERGQLVEGNSKLEVSRSGSQLAGPALAGGLIELVTAPAAILVDAVSFVASGAFVFRIRKRETPPERKPRAERRGSMRRELAEGLRFVLGNRYLRPIAACTSSFNFFNMLWGSVFLVWAVRELGLSAGVIGIVLAVGNVGFLVGALTASRITARLKVGPTIVLGAATSLGVLLIPLAPENAAVPFLIAASVISSFGVVVYNVTQVSFRQALAPERLQGRMNAVMRFLVWGTIPLGGLAGGALASATDLRTTIWVGTIGNALSFLPVLLSPVRSIERMPEPDGEPEAGPSTSGTGVVVPAASPPSTDVGT